MKELVVTPVGVASDGMFFQKVKNVRVVNETKAAETVCRFRPDEAKPASADRAYSLH